MGDGDRQRDVPILRCIRNGSLPRLSQCLRLLAFLPGHLLYPGYEHRFRSVLTCFLIYLIGKELVNRLTGWQHALSPAFTKPFIFYSIVPLKTSLAVVLFTLAVWLLISILNGNSLRKGPFFRRRGRPCFQCPSERRHPHALFAIDHPMGPVPGKETPHHHGCYGDCLCPRDFRRPLPFHDPQLPRHRGQGWRDDNNAIWIQPLHLQQPGKSLSRSLCPSFSKYPAIDSAILLIENILTLVASSSKFSYMFHSTMKGIRW